jgi:hypothetical protein
MADHGGWTNSHRLCLVPGIFTGLAIGFLPWLGLTGTWLAWHAWHTVWPTAGLLAESGRPLGVLGHHWSAIQVSNGRQSPCTACRMRLQNS